MKPRSWFFSVAVVCLSWVPAAIGQSSMVKMDLFTAATDGYALYRIPGIIVTARGTLLAYCEARKNDGGDWGTIDIYLRRSPDGGKTWDKARRIVTPPTGVPKNPAAVKQKLGTGRITIDNPLAIADKSGAVHFLYCVEYARCYYMRSDDDGLTFTPPVDITPTFEAFRPEYNWIVLATGPGHGIQLATGRLVVPVWMSLGTGGGAHRPSCVSTIYSDDSGRTWKRGAIVVNHPTLTNPSESMPVELSDGRVMLNIRSEGPRNLRAISISPDGASRWSEVRWDPMLPDPVCMASIVRDPPRAGRAGGILFSNPHNPDNRQRKNLTVKFSPDDGKTWPLARAIEPGVSGYSDLAVGPDGRIYCFYERGSTGKDHYQTASLTLAKFGMDWLAGKED